MEPVFYLFAGINGAGKTSLFQVISEMVELGKRVSIDENVKMLGDWRDSLTQIRAAKMALRQAFACIEERCTFNQETTLPGVVILRQLEAAKKNGFTVILYFLGVNSPDLAIQRIRRRIARGGHGIPEDLVRRRFEEMPAALARILPYCDLTFFYDNTDMFRQVALFEEGRLVDTDPLLPEWFYTVTGQKKTPASS